MNKFRKIAFKSQSLIVRQDLRSQECREERTPWKEDFLTSEKYMKNVQKKEKKRKKRKKEKKKKKKRKRRK